MYAAIYVLYKHYYNYSHVANLKLLKITFNIKSLEFMCLFSMHLAALAFLFHFCYIN